MPYHDLNVLYPKDITDLHHTLSFHHELGYNIIALSVLMTGKLPPTLPTIAIEEAASKLPAGIRLLTRMTLIISDTTQNHRISSLQSSYDIIALRPTNEKALQLCCSSLECDLISLDMSQRIPFILRFTTVASALQRGIRFEICYSTGISGGTESRRHLISGATSLIRATRGRGIIISSEAKNALGVRAPMDAINLAQVWGLSTERGKEAVCEEAEKVVKLAGLKRSSYRGVIDIIEGGDGASMAGKRDVGTTGGDSVKQVKAQPAKQVQTSNLAKRKASSVSLSGQPNTPQDEGKPVSKKALQRQAKRARTKAADTAASTNPSARPAVFPIPHESLGDSTNE